MPSNTAKVKTDPSGSFFFCLNFLHQVGLEPLIYTVNNYYGGERPLTENAEKLKSQLSRLSDQDRAELAYYLIHTLDDNVDVDAEAAWDAELEKRMAEITNGTAVGEPAEKVIAKMRRKYS